jgi:hypothetical protein
LHHNYHTSQFVPPLVSDSVTNVLSAWDHKSPDFAFADIDAEHAVCCNDAWNNTLPSGATG